MLKGPKSTVGEAIQKLPPLIVMSPKLLVWVKLEIDSPPETPTQQIGQGTHTVPENELQIDSSISISTSFAVDEA